MQLLLLLLLLPMPMPMLLPPSLPLLLRAVAVEAAVQSVRHEAASVMLRFFCGQYHQRQPPEERARRAAAWSRPRHQTAGLQLCLARG